MSNHQKGITEFPNGLMASLIKSGISYARRRDGTIVGPVATGASVDVWVTRLTPSCGKMLQAIAAGHSTKEEIAAASDVSPSSSGLGAGLRQLIDLELVILSQGRYSLAEGM